MVALNPCAPFLPTYVAACPVLRVKAATPFNPRIAPFTANFLVPSFKYLAPFPRAYNTGAPSLSRSLSLASLSELDNGLSLLLCPNLLATSRASTPGALTIRAPRSADGDDDDNDVLLLPISGDGGAVIAFPGHLFILRIVFHSQSPSIVNEPITIVSASCLPPTHQSLVDTSHNLYTMPVSIGLAPKVREVNFVIIAIASSPLFILLLCLLSNIIQSPTDSLNSFPLFFMTSTLWRVPVAKLKSTPPFPSSDTDELLVPNNGLSLSSLALLSLAKPLLLCFLVLLSLICLNVLGECEDRDEEDEKLDLTDAGGAT